MPKVNVHGIYVVAAPHTCHLVELSIDACTKACERLKGIHFPVTVQGRRTRQAPFCEHYLSVDSGEIIGDYAYGWDHSEIWSSSVRVAFLMHFLEPGREIVTPYGKVKIPDATEVPERLATIQYESPY